MRPLGCLALLLLHALTAFAAPVPTLETAGKGVPSPSSSTQHLQRRISPPWPFVIPSFIIGMDLNHAIAILDREKVRGTFNVLGWRPFLPAGATSAPSGQFGPPEVPILAQPPIPRPAETEGRGAHLDRRGHAQLEQRGHFGWLIGGALATLELGQYLRGKNPLDLIGLPWLTGHH